MLYSIFSWIVKITGYPFYWLVFRTKVYYQNKAAQSTKIKGKAIIVANHTSVWDFALMLFLFPFRLLRCVVAEVVYTHFGMGLFLPLMGAIKVNRHEQDYAFISKSVDILNKGGVVEIYPEGRLPDREGDVPPLPFKPSTVYIALESGSPIIPVYSNGKYFAKERARVLIGEPIYVRDLYDETLTEKENIENINEYLRNTIIQLGHELDRKINEKEN